MFVAVPRLAVLFFSAMTLLIMPSCKTLGRRHTELSSHAFDTGKPGLMEYVQRPSLEVCLDKDSDLASEAWKEWIQKAVLIWVEPLRSLSKQPLVSRVDVVDEKQSPCNNSPVRVLISSKAFPGMGGHDYIEVNPTTGSKFGSLVHEFGHAFGLVDIFASERCGDDNHADEIARGICHPDAIMAGDYLGENGEDVDPSRLQLKPMDVDAIKRAFSRFSGQ